MKPLSCLTSFVLLMVAASAAMARDLIEIPAVSGTLVIDGRLDDPAWNGALTGKLQSDGSGLSDRDGGEVRFAVRGSYLCLSAYVPEPDRVVARSVGVNPRFWPEDLVTWTIRFHHPVLKRNLNLSVSVNPLGAYRFQNPSTQEPVEKPEEILVAAARAGGAWTVELAIPLERLDRSGFIGVERVRPAHPDWPELNWAWPEPNVRPVFHLAQGGKEPAPLFQPPAGPQPGTAAIAKRRAGRFAGIPDEVWTSEQRNEIKPEQMIENSLRVRMAKAAEEERTAWTRIDSREGWESFRDQRLKALRESLGPFPERTPLKAETTGKIDLGDGYVIENVVFESRPGLVVTANLYLPERPVGRIPAVLITHSHHAPRFQVELQTLGMNWARAGTAVLVMDQLCAGERIQSQPWSRESYYGRYALGNQLYLAGESLMKWMAWDLIRGIDLLLERPFIDPNRIVMLGAVAGGGDPAAVTAALDARIAAVLPFNFGEAGPEEHYTEGPRQYDFDTAWPGWAYWETTRNLRRSVVDQFFPWFICASVAPRTFVYSFEIGWPAGVEKQPAWARYKKVFEWYGVRDHLDQVDGFGPFPGPGECTNVGTFLRRKIDPILQRVLGVVPPADEYYRPRTEADLAALTPAVAAARHPKTAGSLAYEMARTRLAEARSGDEALAGGTRLAEIRKRVGEKLGDVSPSSEPGVKSAWKKTFGEVEVEGLLLDVETGITIPALLLKPSKTATARMPVVLAVAQSGKQMFLSERQEELSALRNQGNAVCLPDLRATGEVAATESRAPGGMTESANELMLGRTLLGLQVKDARTVLRYLASRSDLDSSRIALWGDSSAAVNPPDFAFDQSEMQTPGPYPQYQAEPMGPLVALLVSLFEDKIAAVAVRGGLVSYLSVLEDRFCRIPQDVVVPGILEAGDVVDFVGANPARSVLLDRLVDGRNRIVSPDRLQSEFGGLAKRMPGLETRSAEEKPGVAGWLSDRVKSSR